uniref:Fibroblast growth factor n=1 Tax=Oncorhynchus kisutch TaxID=8019 RepID=A0A8C7L7W1_ONCKI
IFGVNVTVLATDPDQEPSCALIMAQPNGNYQYNHPLALTPCLCICALYILKVKAMSAGVVAIKDHKTGRYLAIDKDGNLYGSICYFPEKMEENYYNTNRSQKNGQPKAGPRTHIGHKTIYSASAC